MSGRKWTPADERQALLAHAAELMAMAQAAIYRAGLTDLQVSTLVRGAEARGDAVEFGELSGEEVRLARRHPA